jgi:hypothetical protein
LRFNKVTHLQTLTVSAAPSDSDGWNLTSVHGLILSELKNCLEEFVNLFGATSATHVIVNRLPRGVDKLVAAR